MGTEPRAAPTPLSAPAGSSTFSPSERQTWGNSDSVLLGVSCELQKVPGNCVLNICISVHTVQSWYGNCAPQNGRDPGSLAQSTAAPAHVACDHMAQEGCERSSHYIVSGSGNEEGTVKEGPGWMLPLLMPAAFLRAPVGQHWAIYLRITVRAAEKQSVVPA